MKKSLCLNMIVKDESHIIKDTLTKLCEKIKFDYYVICDTGSTDNTINLILSFFKGVIPGEIHKHKWENFGHNRTLALKAAYKKTDYILIFDADDYIHGSFVLPDLCLDAYMLKFGNSTNAYERMCLVKNDIVWEYRGVLHEYISTQTEITSGNITGEYYIVSGRTISRNKDANKYQRDSEILEKGYYDSLKNNDGLHNRYSYYCANSYNDAGNKDKAIEWYTTTLKCNGWFDEKYNSCLQLHSLTDKLDYLVESYNYNPKRVEGIFYLIRHYTCQSMYGIAMGYYTFIKEYYENEYSFEDLNKLLFANVLDYTFYLPYYMIIVCEKTKDYSTGLKMYNIIFQKRNVPDQWWIDNLLYNLQFFDYSLLTGIEDYLLFLKTNGKTIPDLPHLNKFNKVKFKQFDILFYTGFSNKPWNKTYSLNNALGGSERAVIHLTENLPKHLKIVVTGDVHDEIVENVHYINRFKINNSYQFDYVVVSRYVSFFTIYPDLKFNKLVMMAHDTYFMNNLYNCSLSPNEILEKNKFKIDSIIYLTEWQKNYYETTSHPECKSLPSFIINNGIQLDLFPQKRVKIPNTFIYTSGSHRGLKRLLELWPDILKHLPDAKLSICSYEDFPKNDEEIVLQTIINELGVTHLGKLDNKSLYDLMDCSEYWLYPCSFNETSCITAMEMLMSGVICLYYSIAGLADTMQDYGIAIKHGNEIDTLINLKDKSLIVERGINYAKSLNWKNRADEWVEKVFKKKPKMLFYARSEFPEILLQEYITSLNQVYNVDYTTSIKECDYSTYDELVYVHETYDRSQIGKFKQVNYLNTEPLNLECRMLYILQNVAIYPGMKIYDYSLGNIDLMKKAGVKNECIHFPYLFNKSENAILKQLKQENQEVYDFGIICSYGDTVKPNGLINPPRRNKVYQTLVKNGFKINTIKGFGINRDRELAKCKIILNIHGQFISKTTDESCKIFEHIRCDRLLNAGYTILSEDSYLMENNLFNLKFKSYDAILKLKPKVIVDCFTFYNEIDMLMFRLNTLDRYVDYFVLSEATLTHVGKPKELYYENNKHLFKQFQHKIIHIVVDDFKYTENNIDVSKNQQWINEKHQRNCLVRGFSQIEHFDYCIVSDVDEIPDPTTLNLIKTGIQEIPQACQFEQDFYYYNIESKMDHLWYFSKIINYQWFLTTDLKLDDIRFLLLPTIPRGGWHLSYFGKPEFIANKIKNFAHQEFNNENFTDTRLITERVTNGIDIYDRPIKIEKISTKINKYLPVMYNLDYCFIHSCNLNRLNRLKRLMDALKTCNIVFKKIFIVNIGEKINETFDNTTIIEYSNDPLLFEIPTINKIVEFSKLNPNDTVVYLHTKGVAHHDDYHELNDWIELMLYMLLQNKNKFLLNTYDCIGSNYKTDPLPHFSGNFWWANCKYLSTLEPIPEKAINKNDAEYFLMKGKPDYLSLHNSTVNHYHQRYPKEMYS
jgi:hypothetical protein